MSLDIYQQDQPTTLNSFEFNPYLENPKSYRVSKDLQDAVNVALMTGLPLLLTGEPGTGKTRLAYHLADHFGLEEPLVFNVRTSSIAKDLFYKYDSLGHFQYIQSKPGPTVAPETIEKNFIHYNALGKAIKSEGRQIVLIDEIDKAPRDLPNDILVAIESLEFEVPEINRTKANGNVFKADKANRPVIIITSNSEKNLPDAFLRRCVYYHIPFPGPEELVEIVHMKSLGYNKEQIRFLIEYFGRIREIARYKPPATAELIYWTLFLEKQQFPLPKLKSDADLNESEKRILRTSFSLLLKNADDLEHAIDLLT